MAHTGKNKGGFTVGSRSDNQPWFVAGIRQKRRRAKQAKQARKKNRK